MSTAAAPSSRRPAWAAIHGSSATRSSALAGRVLAVAFVVGPLALFAVHAARFGRWLIDDAGISFAYARNLAEGHGLVAQPGAAPVEGFSNPAWTLLVAALQALHLFDVAWTPKVLSLALVSSLFLLLHRDARATGSPAWAPALATTLLALSTSFVVWASSGLENPLLALLVAASCAVTRRGAVAPRAALDVAAGALAGLAALTRPDAILLAAAFPACLLAVGAVRGEVLRRTATIRGLRFAAGLAMTLLPYLAFRRAYFGDWFPNTYYAKEKPSPLSLLDVAKAGDLLASVFGFLAVAAAALLVLELVRLPASLRDRPRHAVLLVHLGLALAGYLLMPADWMGEYRFATAAIVFSCWWLAEQAAEGVRAAGPTARIVLACALVLLVADSAVRHAARSAAFAQKPPAPFASVAAFAGRGYNALAAALGPGPASLLTPDVGGAFYFSSLRVHDLVGLCDREAARTLTHDTAAFHRYVFERLQPTFIHVHGAWSGWASLHAAPAFTRDYAPLFESRGDAFVEGQSGGEPSRGDYVRREALRDPGALARLRRVFVEEGLDRAAF